MGRFSPSQGTLKNSSRSIYFTTKRKWWKYRDEEMKHSVNVYLLHLFSAKFTHKLSNYDIDLLSNFRYPLALSKRASLTLKFWMLWNEDLQTLEDTLTFFGQSFLFTMKLIFCRISFGQMRRQIIDLVVGKRYTGNGSSWKLLNRLWKYLRIDYALVLCGDDATNKK
ncbi:hypothetical protein T01_11965 [Trichinella spiralis]|uniref:Uncharacterized protein n=1 Tax=Trichinella spiralis TaxID=6334 RepID=A0A0V1BHI7_TRISP|nr:hypothetical protein T01_11965 [Trichinella spiralis]